jgi:hypothetical protein
VNGNAENIYFNRKKGKITEMEHSISSTITLNMKNGAAANISYTTQNEHKATPIAKVKEDDKILKGFIWKPKDRPASKEDVIHPKKPEPEKEIPKKGTDGKPVKGGVAKPGATGKPVTTSAGKDSVTTNAPVVKAPLLIKKDSIAAKKDTVKKAPLPQLKKDTVKKVPVK